MTGQVLVPLSSHDRIKDIVPRIEEIAEPGTRVIFLMRYPVDSWAWLRDHWIDMESPRDAMLAGRKIMETYTCDAQRELAEQKILPACKALRKMRMELAVDIYTGSFTKVLENYTREGPVQLVMPARGGFAIMRFLHRTITLAGLFRRTGFPPVLHQGH